MNYNQEYYQKHKNALSRRRKARYRKDKEFQMRIRRNSHNYYHSVKKSPHIVDKQVLQGVNGEKLFTIGKLSIVIRRSIDAIRSYHKKGIIPDPSYCDTRGWRLYERENVILLKDAFKKLDTKELRNLRAVAEYIRERWKTTQGEVE